MSGFRLAGFVLSFSLSLCAQQPLNEHQVGAYKGDDQTVRSVMNYCDAVDRDVQGEQPRIFAGLKNPAAKSAGDWKEFASRDEWDAAGKPGPLAFVWNGDGAIVRVTIVWGPPRVGAPAATRRRVTYCYGTDTKLKRIRAVWYPPTHCEFLFPCRLIGDQEFVLGGRWPGVTDWVITADGAIQKLRDGKAEQNYFDPSYSLSADDLHLKTSADLPFGQTTPPK